VPIESALKVSRAFGRANLAVLGGYLVLMLAIGFVVGRHIKGTRGYFIADGRMNYVVVGLSILGTYLSALTMMGLPGMSYGVHDWTYTVQLPCLVITAMVITALVLPAYRRAGVVSIYQYLEDHIHVSARMVAGVSFIVFAIGRAGLVLYLPALAFATVTGIPLWLCIVVMGAVITAYTVIGGIEAVIWTDALQVVIFIAGAALTLIFIFQKLGVDQFLAIGLEHNKFRTIIPGFDPRKIVTAWLVLETIFQTIRIYGTQQDVAQRYLTTPSVEKANRSVWIAILAYIPLGFIFYFMGTALFAFYKAHPDVNLPGKADPVYPFFVVNELPVGVAGLVIAAMFAAAMSSIDSVMNSSSTVCVEDFYKRWSRRVRTDRQYLRIARWLTVLWGGLATVMALLFMKTQYAQIVWGKLMGIATNGILGLMALAFIPVRIDKWAALAGFTASYAALFLMMGTGVNFLLWPVVGNLTCFFVALFLNPLFRRPRAATLES
jgi:SSS family transporter